VNFHVVTQSEPSYPAGDKVLFTYFADSIKYSDEAKAKGISGNVLVSFNVMPDSTLSDVFVLSGVGYGIDDEVVKLLTPLKYAPGIQSGEKTKMNVILTVPVKAQ
jgi:protein TonB